MKRKGLGVGGFARQVPVEPNSVSRWRAGFVPGPVHLQRVADLLDTTTGYLKDGATSDPESWPAGQTLGGTPTSAPGNIPTDSQSPDNAAARPALPEPVIPDSVDEWTNTILVFKLAMQHLDDLDLPPAVKREVRFFYNQLAVAAQMDLARALPAPVSNGEQHRA